MYESWDLGFNFKKSKTTKYFTITFLFVEKIWPIEKIVKKIISWFSKKEFNIHNWALHCYKEHPKTRIRLLKELVSKDISIMTIYVDKSRVYTHLHEEKDVLYNYITNILLDRIFTKKLIPIKDIKLIVSQRETNKFLKLFMRTSVTESSYRYNNRN